MEVFGGLVVIAAFFFDQSHFGVSEKWHERQHLPGGGELLGLSGLGAELSVGDLEFVLQINRAFPSGECLAGYE